MAGPHDHDEKPKEEKVDAKAKLEADKKAREEYAERMKRQNATLPKGFIKGAEANTGH